MNVCTYSYTGMVPIWTCIPILVTIARHIMTKIDIGIYIYIYTHQFLVTVLLRRISDMVPIRYQYTGNRIQNIEFYNLYMFK